MVLLQHLPEEFHSYLLSFLSATHPSQENKVYHNLFHSFEVVDLVQNILDYRGTFDKWKILMKVAVLLHDLDPERQPNTPPSVARTVQYLEHNPEGHFIIKHLCKLFGFTPQQVNTLILATDYSENPEERKIKWDLFCQACLIHFKEANTAIILGTILAYADKAATYLLPPDIIVQRVKGLALELRTLHNSDYPTDMQMLGGTSKFITSELINNSMFLYLPTELRSKLEKNRAFFTEFI